MPNVVDALILDRARMDRCPIAALSDSSSGVADIMPALAVWEERQ